MKTTHLCLPHLNMLAEQLYLHCLAACFFSVILLQEIYLLPSTCFLQSPSCFAYSTYWCPFSLSKLLFTLFKQMNAAWVTLAKTISVSPAQISQQNLKGLSGPISSSCPPFRGLQHHHPLWTLSDAGGNLSDQFFLNDGCKYQSFLSLPTYLSLAVSYLSL